MCILPSHVKSTMAGVAKYSIAKLNASLTNIVVVGVIIAKQQMRHFENKKYPNGEASNDRAVINLTIRDSPQYFINVSRWGTLDVLSKEAETLQIGDVVEISNARVAVVLDENAKYRPSTSSPFTLIVSDNGSINKYLCPGNALENLLHLPTRSAHDYMTLSQVEIQDGREQLPFNANFLAAVIKIDEVQSMTTRDNRQIQKQTVRLLDFTANAVPIDIWDSDLIKRVELWKSRDTVLFIADARVKWDEYKKCKVISLTSASIITEDPNVPEAIAVRNYARNAPINFNDIMEDMSKRIPDLSLITDLMSIQQIKIKIEENESFYAVVNAFLTKLNIDGPGDPISLQCWHCHSIIRRNEYICSSESCAGKEAVFTAYFNILTSLTDRTGTLENVRLSGKVAEKILGIDADDFLEKDQDEVETLKCQLLLEKWDMKIGVQRRNQRLIISLLSCEKPTPNEASARGIAMI